MNVVVVVVVVCFSFARRFAHLLFYELLERDNMSSLEAKVGPQVMAWLAEDLQRLAVQEEVELQEGPSEEPQEPDGDEDLAADAPELAMGWRLNDRFMDTFAAVLRERAAAAAEQGIVDDSPEVDTVDALLAMANRYRAHGFDGEEEDLEPEGEEEVDEDLEAVQQEARAALQRLEEEMGDPGEAAAREAAEQALEEVLAVQTERQTTRTRQGRCGSVPLERTLVAVATIF
ncbi:hypothetical protein Vretimale_11692 [Volvox reticuliferus]|uniref:Uncharacterized protein n=2 Tax=Volvox reticuliferus TaxID=1737510 RepID=A0A8J4LS14_9CHLO|nr:hypothetical protein Vretifemale_20960 [Volvox reticuliferus]GIM07621.1 hypothetical protein Vretimale_11692 [Volvox reticuliferus]